MGTSGKGWITLSRSLQEHWLWECKPFSKGQAWIDLIMLANHKDKICAFGSSMVPVKRGQTVTSIQKLSARWGWDRKTVTNFLNILESDGMIAKCSTTQWTTITIIKYDDFQNHGTTKRTTNGQRDGQRRDSALPTNKELKELIKNDKEVLPPEEVVGVPDEEIEWSEE